MAIALAIHGQIEMTFFDPGCVVWAMCVLGLAGPVPEAGPRSSWAGSVGAAVIIALALWLAVVRVPPAFAAQRFVLDAAQVIGAAEPRGQTDARAEAAGLLEVAQLWVPGRSWELMDLVAGAAGALAAVLIGLRGRRASL